MTKIEYTPGQRLRELEETSQPLSCVEISYELGFYFGKYVVVGKPKIPFRSDLERVRVAAEKRWQDRIIDYTDIFEWISQGAIDPETKEKTVEVSAENARDKTLLFLDHEIFDRPGGVLAYYRKVFGAKRKD